MSTTGKTFKQASAEWWEVECARPEYRGMFPSPILVEKFAAWLDEFQFLTPQLQVLAMLSAREVDKEFISALIDEVGKEKATEIARKIHAAHRDKPAAPEERSQLDVHKEIDEITGEEPPESGGAGVPA